MCEVKRGGSGVLKPGARAIGPPVIGEEMDVCPDSEQYVFSDLVILLLGTVVEAFCVFSPWHGIFEIFV